MIIGKIYIRSIVGIMTAGIVTVFVGNIVSTEIMIAMYAAIGGYIYVDKELSGETK